MLAVVGSPGRKAGKTAFICALIRAFPEASWTAIKISGHEHGAGAAYVLTAELDPDGAGDTSRFLRAGAVASFWLRAKPDRLADAMPSLRRVLAVAANAVIESNSVMELVDPDLYLIVAGGSAGEAKESAHRYRARADAVISVNGDDIPGLPAVPRFAVQAATYWSAELAEFLKTHLRA
jgi:hypothetical protein